MELEELKTGWNALSKRLEDSEVVNLRLVKEVITQKTRTAYDNVYKQNLYNLVVCVVIIAGVFPWVYSQTPISTVSFVIVEAVMVIGLIPQVMKLFLLSGFDLEQKKCTELSGLVLRYKQICHHETIWGTALVCLAMCAFYISELGFNKEASYVFGTRLILPLALTVLTFGMGLFIAKWQRRRHAQQMLEIERGLEELREFEEK